MKVKGIKKIPSYLIWLIIIIILIIFYIIFKRRININLMFFLYDIYALFGI